jgi:hypothetical protein
MATNEISNSNWAGGRIINAALLPAGTLVPPTSVTGTTTTTNYPAYGVFSITKLPGSLVAPSPGTYLIELEQPAADAELTCEFAIHGPSALTGALIGTCSMPPVALYPSINGGMKDQTNFRVAQFTNSAGALTDLNTSADFMLTHLPFAGQQ